MATITCTACGTVLGVPKGGIPKGGLSCSWCGYVNVTQPEPEAQPVSAKSRRERPVPSEPAPKKPKAPAHRWGDDEDDNGEPYSLPAEEVKTCPCQSCGRPIDAAAVVCVHCGYNAASGQKVERTHQAIDREWVSGWPLFVRLGLLAGCQVINVSLIMFGIWVGGTLPGSIAAIAFYVFLQAFLLGTYDSVRIRRNEKGKTDITITWRVCFVPMRPAKVKWRDHEGVGIGHYDAASVFDWIIGFSLLPFLIFPAILWWYYVILPDRFYTALCRDHGHPETYLYRGMNEKQAKEIAQIATDVTGLPLTTPI